MKQLTRLVKQVVIKKFQWQEMKIRGKWPKSCFLIPQLHILPRLKESGLNSGLGGCFFEFGEDRAKEPEAMEKEWDLVTLSDGKIEVTEEQSAGSELCPREGIIQDRVVGELVRKNWSIKSFSPASTRRLRVIPIERQRSKRPISSITIYKRARGFLLHWSRIPGIHQKSL